MDRLREVLIKKGRKAPLVSMINQKVTYHHKYMSIPANIPGNLTIPRFLFAPDPVTRELFVTCTSPLALIWVRQTTPAQLYIMAGPLDDEQLLRDAGEWWKGAAAKSYGGN